jgi:nucleoside-diphosphate-sugar epimerase
VSKVLITGGAGFIGLSLANSLVADGIETALIDNFARGKNDAAVAKLQAKPGVKLFNLDLSNSGTTDVCDSNYDIIFHFAAILGVANVSQRPSDTLTLNVELTREALRLARRQHALQAFVFSSTSEVYAGSQFAGLLQFPTPENSIIALPSLEAPRTSYMLSKIYGEALVHQAGIPGIIVRPHNIYGPRMGTEHVIPELMKRMRQAFPGSEIEVFSPAHTRTFCFIDDAVTLIKGVAFTNKAVGQVWNIGTETPEYAVQNVAEIIQSVVNAEVKLVAGPDSPGSPRRRCPSMARTNALTGFITRVPLEEGILQTYQWYDRNVFK